MYIYIYICMKEDRELIIPKCKKCGSQQIRTTREHRICVRCGNKEGLE